MSFRALIALVVLVVAPAAGAEAATVRLVDFQDVNVTLATAKRITQAVADAEAAGDAFVLIEIDTPGGDVRAMERIVKSMLNAEVPIVAWVGPSGAHAASAGFFILLSADVAAMAPGTRTGAASVIYGMGQKSEEGDVALEKANKDLAALMRSIADRRGRSIEAAEKAVFSADAYSEGESLEERLIELIANDRQDLLAQLDGYEVTRFDGTTAILETSDVTFVTSESGLKDRIAEVVSSPSLAFLLLIIGIFGIYMEIQNPGLIFPAVIGVASLILFFVASQMIPVSAIGLLLMILSVVLFVLEVKVASHGALAAGGVVALVAGSLMLFDSPIPALRVHPGVVLPIALTTAAIFIVILRFAVQAQRAKVATGVEGLAGEIGTVLDPAGKVFVHGEVWDASWATGPLDRGTQVRVVEARGMKLTVEPVQGVDGGRD